MAAPDTTGTQPAPHSPGIMPGHVDKTDKSTPVMEYSLT